MENGYPVTRLPDGCPWSTFQPPQIKYCEENLCSWITAPANTWSNLGYIVIGVWLWQKLSREKAGLAVLFGPAAIATGVTSFLYHASYTFVFQLLDYVGMFAFASLLLVLNLYRGYFIKRKAVVPLYVVLAIASTLPFAFSGGSFGRSIFGLELLLAFVFEFFLSRKPRKGGHRINYTFFWWSIGIFLVSYAAWWSDTGHLYCNPTNHLIQGHAVWHIVNAFCFITMAKFYRQFSRIVVK